MHSVLYTTPALLQRIYQRDDSLLHVRKTRKKREKDTKSLILQQFSCKVSIKGTGFKNYSLCKRGGTESLVQFVAVRHGCSALQSCSGMCVA
mmetsp:Transcript_46677/g.75170  ORF Transcript_46677/g.75170 Transcript_46677/m.75170 type:complete len:92 (+) Transcript_46677:31-306(+)